VDIRPLFLRLTEVIKHSLSSRCGIIERWSTEFELEPRLPFFDEGA
jgi:hypothetical protein